MSEPVVEAVPSRPEVTEADGALLARRAAAAIAYRLAGQPADGRLPAATSLRALGATFVTLEDDGALLGCVGTLDPARPRYLDVMRNAVRAAADPRLPPVTAAEWPQVDVTVSVLSGLTPVEVADPHELVVRLRVGLDGLILTDGRRRATFLPSVWRKIDSPERFVVTLLHKGGWVRGRPDSAETLPPRDWPADLTALRYTTAEFTDPAPRPAA